MGVECGTCEVEVVKWELEVVAVLRGEDWRTVSTPGCCLFSDFNRTQLYFPGCSSFDLFTWSWPSI